MLDHVLVPLDHSKLAEMALPYAQHILGPQGRITLMTVVEEVEIDYVAGVAPGLAMTGTPPISEAERNRRRGHAEDYLNQILSRMALGPHEVDAQVEFGQPAEAIVDLARKLDVQAIVMSTHGRTGISRWVYGSVTQKVLSATPCPVFIIPSRKD